MKLLPNILKEGVRNCENNIDVLKVIEEASGVLNVTKFEAIAKLYECQAVLDDIKEYKAIVNQSCLEIRDGLVGKSSLCDSLYINQPLRCESIWFSLRWNTDHDTYEKIHSILW